MLLYNQSLLNQQGKLGWKRGWQQHANSVFRLPNYENRSVIMQSQFYNRVEKSSEGTWNAKSGGRVMSASSPLNFRNAIPRAYPKVFETETATAFPTWQYLEILPFFQLSFLRLITKTRFTKWESQWFDVFFLWPWDH